jgi:hypothetical protein
MYTIDIKLLEDDMNQDVMNLIKIYLNEFPQFFKNLLRNPFVFVDREVPMDWTKIILYGFLIEAGTNTLYSLAILNISGIAGSLIFSPIQTLMVIGFISFLIWFVLDRIGFTQSVLAIFRVIVVAEMLTSIIAVPVMIALAYIKSLDLIYIASALWVLAKAYLVFRALSRQFQLSNKRAFSIVGIFTIIFLAPIVSDFFDGFSMRKQVRATEKLQQIQMEQSIDELEKELGGGEQ